MTRHPTPDSSERTAALITAMMLRFPQSDLPPVGTEPPQREGEPREAPLILFPSGARLAGDALVDWLQRQVKPVIVAPLYVRGHIAVWTDDGAAHHVERQLANQRQALQMFQQQYDIRRDTEILLETDEEAVVFPFVHLQEWANTYSVLVGWNVAPAKPEAEVPPRMLLVAPGRKLSPGWSREPPPDDEPPTHPSN